MNTIIHVRYTGNVHKLASINSGALVIVVLSQADNHVMLYWE